MSSLACPANQALRRLQHEDDPSHNPRLARRTSHQARTDHRLRRPIPYRNCAVWAHALVAFNSIGIPFSFGSYLEYYYNTVRPDSSPSYLFLVIALQLFTGFTTSYVIVLTSRWLDRHLDWKVVFCVAIGVAFPSCLILQWIQVPAVVLVSHGFLLGLAIAATHITGVLIISAQYQQNVPLVSMQSWSAGFTGATVYSLIAEESFRMQRSGALGYAHSASAGIMAVTLLIAAALLHKAQSHQTGTGNHAPAPCLTAWQHLRQIYHEDGAFCLLAGYLIILTHLFIWPVLQVLILVSPPWSLWPDFATRSSLAMSGTSALSASMAANSTFRKHIGPLQASIAASMCAGASLLILVWTIAWIVPFICSLIYGFSLGIILTSMTKVIAIFLDPFIDNHTSSRTGLALTMLVAAFGAPLGLCIMVVIAEQSALGSPVALSLSAASLIIGGLLLAVARWRRCQRLGVAI